MLTLAQLAAGIKPVFHLWRRLQQRSAELQSIISQPSSDEWTSVVERLTSLETAFNQLVGTAALKTDVRQLKTALDTPLTDLVKAVARHERKNDLLRLSAQSRFEELAEQLSDLDAECEAHEAILDDLSGQLEEARQKYSDEHRRTQWIKIILFGSAAGGSSDSQQAPGVRQILGSALHILFLPLTAPFQASTLLLRYAGRRLFLPAPPHCSPTSQPPALSSTSNSIATTPHPSPKDVPLKSNLKKTS